MYPIKFLIPLLCLLPSLVSAAFVTTENLGSSTSWGGNTVNQPLDSSGGRTIDMYDTSLFSGLSGIQEISALGFRAEVSGLNYSADDFEIRISTRSSSVNINGGNSFSSLHGANVTQVRNGAFSVTTDNTDFFMINLDSTFLWDTTQVLIVELNILTSASSDPVLLNSFNPTHGLPDRRGYNGSYNSTSVVFGTNDLTTLKIEFAADSVPTPAPAALLVLGAFMLIRRQKHS